MTSFETARLAGKWGTRKKVVHEVRAPLEPVPLEASFFDALTAAAELGKKCVANVAVDLANPRGAL